MGQVLHGSARTTEAVRRAIQLRQESVRALARRFGGSPTTVQKWRKRSTTADAKMGPKVVRNAVAIADAGRDGEVRFYGEVDASPESMRRLAARLAGRYQHLHFCYEAGPTGYGLHRLLAGREGEAGQARARVAR